MRLRKRSYQLFASQNQAFLKDLANFCRADTTTYDPDPAVRDILLGRREVWLRIQQHLHLTSQQLVALYSGSDIPETEKTDG